MKRQRRGRDRPRRSLFDVSQQAERIAGQRFAFFRRRDVNTAEIAVAILAKRFHVVAVVVAQVPLVLLGKEHQRASDLCIGRVLVATVVFRNTKTAVKSAISSASDSLSA